MYHLARKRLARRLWPAGVAMLATVGLAPAPPQAAEDLSTTNRLNTQHFWRAVDPCVSYETMRPDGFIPDRIHPNKAGNTFLTDVLWPQLGFFALRAERRLELERALDGRVLGWASTPNIVYSVETSSNLAEWMEIARMTGTGQRQRCTNAAPVATNPFFRLSLTPC